MKLKGFKLYPVSKSPGRGQDGFYRSKLWRDARAYHLGTSPLCVHCEAQGKVTEATIVDHIVPRSQGGLPFAESNLQSLCESCHARKSQSERAE
jgi:5-methylcytosine-specific restriction enzyme A